MFLLLIIYLRTAAFFHSVSLLLSFSLLVFLEWFSIHQTGACDSESVLRTMEKRANVNIYSQGPALLAYCTLHADPKHRSKIIRSVVIIPSWVWITAADVLWRFQAWLEECCLWIRQEFGANSVFFSSKCPVSRRFLASIRASGKYRIQAR